MSEGVRIELPWPAKELFPNYRSRTFHAKARATKAAREWAYYATLAAPIGRLNGIPAMRVEMIPPNRRMDDDNIKAGFKAYRDGIADALHINDKRLQPVIEIGEPVRAGKVVVTLEARS